MTLTERESTAHPGQVRVAERRCPIGRRASR